MQILGDFPSNITTTNMIAAPLLFMCCQTESEHAKVGQYLPYLQRNFTLSPALAPSTSRIKRPPMPYSLSQAYFWGPLSLSLHTSAPVVAVAVFVLSFPAWFRFSPKLELFLSAVSPLAWDNEYYI